MVGARELALRRFYFLFSGGLFSRYSKRTGRYGRTWAGQLFPFFLSLSGLFAMTVLDYRREIGSSFYDESRTDRYLA